MNDAPPKICRLCGLDCAHRPRTRDRQGRYFCTECYQQAVARKQRRNGHARPALPASAARLTPAQPPLPSQPPRTSHSQRSPLPAPSAPRQHTSPGHAQNPAPSNRLFDPDAPLAVDDSDQTPLDAPLAIVDVGIDPRDQTITGDVELDDSGSPAPTSTIPDPPPAPQTDTRADATAASTQPRPGSMPSTPMNRPPSVFEPSVYELDSEPRGTQPRPERTFTPELDLETAWTPPKPSPAPSQPPRAAAVPSSPPVPAAPAAGRTAEPTPPPSPVARPATHQSIPQRMLPSGPSPVPPPAFSACPNCTSPIALGTIICLACGYDLLRQTFDAETLRRAAPARRAARSGWMGPLMLAIIAIALVASAAVLFYGTREAFFGSAVALVAVLPAWFTWTLIDARESRRAQLMIWLIPGYILAWIYLRSRSRYLRAMTIVALAVLAAFLVLGIEWHSVNASPDDMPANQQPES